MIQTIVQQVNLNTILLVTALIAAFIIASKIMEMIFDTAIIATVSAGFYITLITFQGGQISFNDLLLFTFLGSTIYMTYNLIQTLYQIGSKTVTIPFKITKTVFKTGEIIFQKIKWIIKTSSKPFSKKGKQKNKNESEENRKKEKSTKEVILGNKEKRTEEET